eukprot:1105539-Amphidinium_carterae.1
MIVSGARGCAALHRSSCSLFVNASRVVKKRANTSPITPENPEHKSFPHAVTCDCRIEELLQQYSGGCGRSAVSHHIAMWATALPASVAPLAPLTPSAKCRCVIHVSTRSRLRLTSLVTSTLRPQDKMPGFQEWPKT